MKYTFEQQKLYIEYLISSPDTFALCEGIVDADYFNPKLKNSVSFVKEYYTKYNALPDIDTIAANTGSIFIHRPNPTSDQIKYCADSIEQFCKTQGLKAAIIEASTLYDTPNVGRVETLIKEALAISLHKDLGIDYFKNPLARLEEYAQEPQRLSTGWRDLDDVLGGGLAKSELLMVSANSGGGKSIALANLAVNMFTRGKRVVYLSLELSQKMIEERINTMITGYSTVEWTKHIPEIAQAIEDVGSVVEGHLVIKRMNSGTTSINIKSYIKEYELKYGVKPDLLIVDYLDKMNPNERVSADNISQKDKLIAEQLVDVLIEYNMMGATASQQNREAITATDLHQGHIAGGLTKINAVDWYFSIIFDKKMKAASTMLWQCLKARSSDSVGKKIGFVWDNDNLRIKNTTTVMEFDDDGVIIDKIAHQKINRPGSRKTLKDMIDAA
jgi:KaiC/GvpD/RAD55 family RecA-like ATPase